MYDPTKAYTDNILEIIKTTWDIPYADISEGIYPVIKKNFDYKEVDHTDGIGTKGYYYWKENNYYGAVLDALAMNLNDLALMRAIPYKLQNHIMIPEDDKNIVIAIMMCMAMECEKREIAITGGETSVHNNMDGMDISMTVSGFVVEEKPNQFQSGDWLIGLKSTGLHSNGFTKVRELFPGTLSPEFVKPTAIYLDQIIELEAKYNIHGMMHITGGAFTKLKKILPSNCDINIYRSIILEPHQIFKEIYKQGVSDEEMYKTFNCGTGFILSVSHHNVMKILDEYDNADIIGTVVPGKGRVRIDSMFSGKEVVF
ncbi:MAG: hypothetical protein KKF46_00730 [Nanoarchaeota archaeon]|nr:hypothetical protein [Nanoarchaeota archaeon]MBU1320858.1 hypothetical protein [Nanoarchaeota archaeon]MBU1597924.1 hypothetical protein [Nanoarchaeota archaeon]MBU2441340.1 hypothetical protein [Nanoarchaeota archaeon]